MKIRIIDLLNKIYNNDNIPKRIIYDNCKWEYLSEYSDYKNEYKSYLFGYYIANYDDIHSFLNQEIEIEEAPKKIERIDIINNVTNRNKRYIRKDDNEFFTLSLADYCLAQKINEIIDVVNKMIERSE